MRKTKDLTKGIVGGVYFSSWKDPIYSTSFHILISPTISLKPACDFFAAIREDWEYDESDAAAKALCASKSGTVYGHEVFLLFQSDAPVASIVHELIHAKNFVFDFHGVKLDPNNDEHEAYYITYLINKCLEAKEEKADLERKQKKRKNAKKN